MLLQMPTELVSKLSLWSGLQATDIERLIRTAPRRYKVFTIPKRNGGERVVAQPSRELKMLQRLIVERVINDLPIHDAVHGYVAGRGIKSNAAQHAGSNFILKMDFSDFFPSIHPGDLGRHLKRYLHTPFSTVERTQLYKLLFWRPKGQSLLRLCIGAPSSPFVSNTIMFRLDEIFSSAAKVHGITYTRYADDLTFSCIRKGVLGTFEREIHNQVAHMRSPRLTINENKTVHISRAQRRMVTGVVINSTGDLSLGRERKRLIRSMAYRSNRGLLSSEEEMELSGLLSFAHDIEPVFAQKMRLWLVRASEKGGGAN